ncbi:MAG: hypothetical protein R6T99_00440 [Bacteroidales bacterium]
MSEKRFQKLPMRNEEHGFEWGTPLLDDHGFLSIEDERVKIAGEPVNWWVANYGLPLHIFYLPVTDRGGELFHRDLALLKILVQ